MGPRAMVGRAAGPVGLRRTAGSAETVTSPPAPLRVRDASDADCARALTCKRDGLCTAKPDAAAGKCVAATP